MQSQYNQRFGVVLTALQKMVRRGGESHIRKIVSKLHPADVAKLLRHFDPDEQWLIFNVIDAGATGSSACHHTCPAQHVSR